MKNITKITMGNYFIVILTLLLVSDTWATNYPFIDYVNSDINWTADNIWNINSSEYHSDYTSWTDSPDTQYENNINSTLTLSSSINLSESQQPVLVFWQKFNFENDYDYGFVEVSRDNGSSWKKLSSYTGKSDWERIKINLSEYQSDTNVKIRFRIETDDSIVDDGWYIDDIIISEDITPVLLNINSTLTTSSSINITWTQYNGSDFGSYQLYRSTKPGVTIDSTPIKTITDKTITSYTDNELSGDTKYYYRIYTINNLNIYAGSKEKDEKTAGVSYFDEDFESGDGNWALEDTWSITDEFAHGDTFSLSEKPGAYDNNKNISAKIRVNLIGSTRPLLTFWHKYNFEDHQDFGYFEVSTNGGSSWYILYYITGFSGSNWEKVKIDLSSYANKDFFIRFRVNTGSSTVYDGWHIDDISITENTKKLPYPFYDDMESDSSPENWIRSTWGIISTDSQSDGVKCITDSPGGRSNYNGRKTELVLSGIIDLSNSTNPQLSFWHRYNLDYRHYAKVYISSNNGNSWTQLWSKDNATLSIWEKVILDISGYKELKNVLLKFTIDGYYNYGSRDGWYIDNVIISDAPENVLLNPPINITERGMTLTWSENDEKDFVQYELYRHTSSNVTRSNTLIATITDQSITSYTDTGLPLSGNKYYYKIYVLDADGFYSTGSNEQYAETLHSFIAHDVPFTDGMEDGDKWVNDMPWDITDEDSHSGSYSWSDSPNGEYENDMQRDLIAKIDMANTKRPFLSFWHKYNFEENIDFGYVSVSNNNGSSWSHLYFVTGFSGMNWEEVQIDLTQFADQVILVRFQSKTNSTVVYDGWHIDDISISDNTTTINFPFFDDMESETSYSNWIGSTWKIISTDAHSGINCITESPKGKGALITTYPELVLKGLIDLSHSLNPQLSFWHRTVTNYAMEVFISDNGGLDWDKVYTKTGTNNTWQKMHLDISQYSGKSEVALKFVLYSHQSYDGWYIDDIRISDAPVNVLLNLPTDVTEHSMKLSWLKNTDTDFVQYEIYRSINPGVTKDDTLVATITDQNTTSYTDTNIPLGGTKHYYKMYILDSEDYYNQGSNEVYGTTLHGTLAKKFPFSDGMEGIDNWRNDLPWTISDEDAHSGQYCWSDSPGGTYENNTERSLNIKIDLNSAYRPMLTFWHKYYLENYLDFGYVEVSLDNGNTWTIVYSVTGFSPAGWEEVNIDFSAYTNEEILLRFRIKTNASTTDDGWYIDDINIDENKKTIAYPFFDDMESDTSKENWITSTWGKISGDGHSGFHCFTDSPKGNGIQDVYAVLTLSGVIDFSNAINPHLSFWHHSHMPYSGEVFVSSNGGDDWLLVWTGTGSSDWQRAIVDLSEYSGKANISLKFQVRNHSSYDGWFIDDVLICDVPKNVYLNLPSDIKEHSMTLSWSKSLASDFVQYELYRNSSANVTRTDTLIATITDQDATSYIDTDIVFGGSKYYYKLFVLDGDGFYNQGSNVVSGTAFHGYVTQNFPFSDSMEGQDNWRNDLPWSITDEDSYNGNFSWSDSPDGFYQNNQDLSLFIRVDLKNAKRSMLTFWHRYNFESYADFGYVELYNGSSWRKVFFVTGIGGFKWEKVEIDLSDYSGIELIIRFRVITNGSVTYDGWHIDDVSVTENTSTSPYPFFDDMEDEGSESNWISSNWSRIATDGNSGNHCFTDSPDGNSVYDVYSDLSLKGSLDFSNAVHPQLSFWYHSNMYYSSSYHEVWLYISTNEGNDWSFLWNKYNTQSNWEKVEIDLSMYTGVPDVLIRFLIKGYNNYDGFYLDDIRIGEDPDIPTFIQKMSGDHQIGETEAVFPKPFVVGVRDSNSDPAPGIPVLFEITSGGGSLSISRGVSDEDGLVSAIYTSGLYSGTNTIKAEIENNAAENVTFSAKTFMANIAYEMIKFSGDNQVAEANSTLPNSFLIKIVDVSGKPVSQTNVSFSIYSGSGSLAYTDVQTDSNGMASTRLTFGTDIGKTSVLVVAQGLKGSPCSFTAFSVLAGGYYGEMDGDKIPDDWETIYGLDPSNPNDADSDNDSDNLTNLQEYMNATDPNDSDTDDDGMPDDWELDYDLDPNDPSDALDDNDSDGKNNLREYTDGTIPVEAREQHFQLVGITDNWMDFYGSAAIEDVPLSPGDEVAAIDPDGVICGQFTITNPGQYGFMHVYKDDPVTTTIDEGAEQDDNINFLIWDLSEKTEITAEVTVTETPKWSFDGDISSVGLNGVGVFSIPLHTGWNLISFSVKKCFYIQGLSGYPEGKPDEPMLPGIIYEEVDTIADVLESIDGKYDLLRSFDSKGAHTFDPDPALADFNDMKYIAGGYAYWIKMNSEGELKINGIRALPSDALNLRHGWNLVGYWHPDVQYTNTKPLVQFPSEVTGFIEVDSISSIIFSIEGNYDIIRSYDIEGGNTYDPMLGDFNDLDYMGPGYGLWIKMKTIGVLSY